MNWDAIGAIGEVVGAVAVVLTLVYLASQLRQANINARAGARQALIENWSNIQFDLGQDPQMLRIGGKGFADFNRLTDEEKTRFVFTMSRYIGNVYNGILLHQQGLLDRETLDEIGGLVATAVHSPGGAVWWASWPHPEPVKKYVDEIIARGEFPSVDVAAPYWLTAWEWPESSDR